MLSSSLLSPVGQTKIYLYAKPTDMRKSFDGLHAIVQSEFRRDIRTGDVFLFLNRRRDRIKLIHWDRDGLAIWMPNTHGHAVRRCGQIASPPVATPPVATPPVAPVATIDATCWHR